MATVRYYFTDAWHAESLVGDKKKIYSHTQKQRIYYDRSDPRSKLPHEQSKKIRTQKIDETANRCNFRIRKYLKFRSES